MTQQFLYVNTDGDYEESVTGAFEVADHINASAGAGDAGKPIILDVDGHVDGSMINSADVNHDDTTGFVANEHYPASLDFSSPDDVTVVTSLGIKTYVDENIAAAGAAAEWQDSVITVQTDATTDPGATPAEGDRYIITNAAAIHANFGTINKMIDDDAAVVLADQMIVEYSGGEFKVANIPTVGTFTNADDETGYLRYFNGSIWFQQSFEATTASGGLEKTGFDIHIDWSTAFNDAKAVRAMDLASNANGEGASIIGIEDAGDIITATDVEGALAENRTAIDAIEDNTITSPNSTISIAGTVGGDDQTVDIDFSTLFNDNKAIQASDLNNTGNNRGASLIGIEDAGGYTDATDVEAALQEIYEDLLSIGSEYDAGEALAIGDLVYISSANTVSKVDITQNHAAIGVAYTAALSGAKVKVLANDTIVPGAISGATAGDKYWWTPSGWDTTKPSASGTRLWLGGLAKNGTDLQVEVKFVKVNR